MSKHLFNIITHVIPASHIRGFSRGIQDEQNGQLCLSLKHYVPKDRKSQMGDPTLILANGIGSSKECQEPFLDDLLAQLPIRGAWACDMANHGASYLLNEDIIGDEPHWLDSARDLLHMVNTFGAQMPPPIYGVGVSWGCVNIIMMSNLHQRLFTGMVLIEPFLGTEHHLQLHTAGGPTETSRHRVARLARRRDTWPSREEAATQLRSSFYFAPFDPRVFDRVVKYDLRDMPTPQHPHAVILTTPKAQEVYMYARPDPPFPGYEAAPDYETRSADSVVGPGFYNGGIKYRSRILGQVSPPVLYLWGTESDLGGSAAYPKTVLEETGVGDEGNGGVKAGMVESRYVKGAHHAVLLEKPAEAAEEVGEWLKNEVEKRRDGMRRKAQQPPFSPGALNRLWRQRLSKL